MKKLSFITLFILLLYERHSFAQLYAPEIKVTDTGNNIGINTLTPDARFTIANIGSNDNTKMLSFAEGSTGGVWFQSGFAPSDGNNFLQLRTILGNPMTWKFDGRVGINTDNPLENLSVYGTGGSDDQKFAVGPTPSRKWVFWAPGYRNQNQYGTYPLIIQRLIGVSSGHTGDFVIQGSTDFKVDINGNAYAAKYYAKNTVIGAWPDFVFAEDYLLSPLKQVEDFIQEYHHLPNIPSEEEVKRDGVELVEMNIKLLQKIEELTLYLIDQEKRLQQVEQTNQELQEQLQTLTTDD